MIAREESRANIWVYEELRNQIENLKLLPGQELNVPALSEQLGVSRSPVRDALLRLERDRLVDIFPQRGTRVSFLDEDVISQERFMRMQVELGALGRCAEIMSEQERQVFAARLRVNLLEQRADLDSGSFIDFLYHDDQLHHMFYTAAGLERVWKIVAAHTGNEHRIRILSFQANGIAESVDVQHHELVAAIEAGDGNKAIEIDRLHLSKLHDEMEEIKGLFPHYFTGGSK